MSKNFLNPDADEVNLFKTPAGSSKNEDLDSLILDLDSTDADAPRFEALPPGVYTCVVDNTEYGPSSKANPMITWVFKVIDPAYEGRLLFTYTVLNNDAGKNRLKRMLTRIVPDLPLGEFSPRKFVDEAQAVGMLCRVKVRVRPYQGQKRNEITDVLPALENTGGSFLDK